MRHILAAVLLATSPVAAQTSSVSQADGRSLVLHGSEGRLLRLEQDAGNIFVGDSSIADVQVISPRLIYVYGRKPGLTRLIGTARQARAGVAMSLLVERSGAAAQAALPPGNATVVGFEGNRMVVRGNV